ncbi:alpha/beta hydrolase [Xinfangfangia sp. D13-10-4-6]|uniref:alpha/beta hydrolase n=1 Tax=Pseudogemmobacter hezensis TaxID=2737662 RepID=UPI0015547A93|nr:alpha/beta hydrolase-fold protein [Pseudogemmobacter hezensis]NPD16851.1 alpha/beta hydrolase [Pseudogemmobacter hezensis]
MTTANRRTILLGAALAWLMPAALVAQQAPPARGAKVPEYRIFDAPPASHSLSRFDLDIDGRGYRTFLAIPTAEAPASGWPSIWMLDGNSVFDRLTPALLEQHPGLAVVAIGYPVDMTIDSLSRSLDYTPVRLESADPAAAPSRETARPTGGAEAFRSRLTGPIREAVSTRAALDPARRTLWGHSYGGLFTLNTLLAEPDSFAAWAPVSASTGFGGGVLRAMADHAPHGRHHAPVLIMLGDSEHRRGTDAPTEPRPNPGTMELAGILKARDDLSVSVTVFEGLGHGQTFVESFGPAFALAESLPPG